MAEISLENCVKSATEGKVYNFHPEFELPADCRHVDIISSNILAMRHITEGNEEDFNFLVVQNEDELNQARKLAEGLMLVNEEWPIVSRI